MSFLDVFDILLLRLSDVEGLVAGIDVKCAASYEGGFGHEEDDKEKHNHHCTAHCMHGDAIRAFLDDRSS